MAEKVSKHEGFTLTEILTTVVILAVLAGVAIPNFSRSKDKALANQAIATLRTIRTAERMYVSREGTYLPCIGTAAVVATCLKNHLGIEVAPANYSFSVAAGATTFSATATGGGQTIILNQTGAWSGTYAPLPALDS